MRTILDMISKNMDKVLKVPMFYIFSVLIVFIVFKFIKREGMAKYIFGLVLLAVSLITIIVSVTNLTFPIAMTMLEFFVLTLGSGVVSLCTAWFLDLFFVKKRK